MSGKESFSGALNQPENIFKKEFKPGDVFSQNFKKIDFSSNDNLIIKSQLADSMLNIYLIYRTNKKSAIELLNDFNSIKDDFLNLLPENINNIQNLNNNLSKKQPGVKETIEATLARFEKLEIIENIFKNHTKGIIVGGSMSYAPFFSVNQNSDVDMLIIYDQNLNPQLFDNIDFFNSDEKKLFSTRVSKFKQLFTEDKADIISQKMSVKNKDFVFSLHFFSLDTLKKFIDQEKDTIINCNHDMISVIRNYRENLTHLDYYPTNFTGQTTKFVSETKNILSDDVIATIHNYIIQNSFFYPGVFYNHISPIFSVLYDKSGEVQQSVDSLKEIITKRFIIENMKEPNSKFYKSHPRYSKFSPNLINSLNHV